MPACPKTCSSSLLALCHGFRFWSCPSLANQVATSCICALIYAWLPLQLSSVSNHLYLTIFRHLIKPHVPAPRVYFFFFLHSVHLYPLNQCYNSFEIKFLLINYSPALSHLIFFFLNWLQTEPAIPTSFPFANELFLV